MKFESKTDLWISAAMLGSATVLIGGLMLAVVELGQIPVGGKGFFWNLLICLLIAASTALLLWIYFGTCYVVLPEHVVVRCGPFRYSLKYENIRSIKPERTLVSGPALSMDRLVIERYDRTSPLVISPEDKEGFVVAVQEQIKEKKIQGTGF